MADQVVVCGFGDGAKASFFIDWASGVEVKCDADGVSVVVSDPDVLDQLAAVLEGLKAD